MKPRFANQLWGAALILAGLLFMAQNMGWIGELSPLFWALAFSATGLLFFVSYFVNGIQAWGWLFPACIFSGLALLITLSETGVNGAALGVIPVFSVAVPFYAAYLLDRKEHWWALIPAWVLTTVSLIVILSDQVAGEVIASLVLFAVGLPFIVVFLANRKNWWALIPGFACLAIGVVPVLASSAREEWIGAYMMFIIAIPFLAVYVWQPGQWWAIIPAGIMASIGITVLLSSTASGLAQSARMGGVMFLGWAITFGILWLQRHVHPTGWAKYVAAVFLAFSLVAFIFGSGFATLWPLVLIGLGVLLLIVGLKPKTSPEM